jgi:hypothetical protein
MVFFFENFGFDFFLDFQKFVSVSKSVFGAICCALQYSKLG